MVDKLKKVDIMVGRLKEMETSKYRMIGGVESAKDTIY